MIIDLYTLLLVNTSFMSHLFGKCIGFLDVYFFMMSTICYVNWTYLNALAAEMAAICCFHRI